MLANVERVDLNDTLHHYHEDSVWILIIIKEPSFGLISQFYPLIINSHSGFVHHDKPGGSFMSFRRDWEALLKCKNKLHWVV